MRNLRLCHDDAILHLASGANLHILSKRRKRSQVGVWTYLALSPHDQGSFQTRSLLDHRTFLKNDGTFDMDALLDLTLRQALFLGDDCSLVGFAKLPGIAYPSPLRPAQSLYAQLLS